MKQIKFWSNLTQIITDCIMRTLWKLLRRNTPDDAQLECPIHIYTMNSARHNYFIEQEAHLISIYWSNMFRNLFLKSLQNRTNCILEAKHTDTIHVTVDRFADRNHATLRTMLLSRRVYGNDKNNREGEWFAAGDESAANRSRSVPQICSVITTIPMEYELAYGATTVWNNQSLRALMEKTVVYGRSTADALYQKIQGVISVTRESELPNLWR